MEREQQIRLAKRAASELLPWALSDALHAVEMLEGRRLLRDDVSTSDVLGTAISSAEAAVSILIHVRLAAQIEEAR